MGVVTFLVIAQLDIFLYPPIPDLGPEIPVILLNCHAVLCIFSVLLKYFALQYPWLLEVVYGLFLCTVFDMDNICGFSQNGIYRCPRVASE